MTLLNCPFCGGEAEMHLYEDSRGVRCKNCCAHLTNKTTDTHEEAAEAWNKRVEPKLEWQNMRITDWYLCLGNMDTGEVGILADRQFFWHDNVGAFSGKAINVDQAKADCEASVRKSLEELM